MKRNRISLLLVACMVITLTGCAGTSQVKENSHVTDTPIEKIQLKYSLWGGDARREYTEQSIKEFERLHPEIEVEIVYGAWTGFKDYMDEAISNGTEADVCQLNYSWLAEYSPDGSRFYDIEELSDTVNLSGYTSDDLQYGRRAGVLNALPNAMNTAVFVYNVTLLQQMNIELPKTWDDMSIIGRQLKAKGKYLLGMEKWQMCSLCHTYSYQLEGKSPFDENNDWNIQTEDIQEVVFFCANMLKDNVFMMAEDFSMDKLTAGEVLGVVCWSSEVEKYGAAISEGGYKYSLGNFPINDDAKAFGYYVKPATLLAVSKNTEHPVEAAMLLDYLENSKENALRQKTEKGIPTSKLAEMTLMQAGELDNYNYRAKLLMDYNMDKMSDKPGIIENTTYVDGCSDNILAYIAGQKTLEEAAACIRELAEGLD